MRLKAKRNLKLITLIQVCLISVACNYGNTDKLMPVYASAISAYQSGNMQETISLSQSCLDIDKNFLPAVMLKGKAQYFDKNDDEAIKTFLHAASLSHNTGEAAIWLSRAYRTVGKLNDAKRICELALKSDPCNIMALRLLANVEMDNANTSIALACLNKAVELSAEIGLVYSDRAAVMWAAGNKEIAMSDLALALQLLPKDSSAHKAVNSLLQEIISKEPRKIN